MPDINYLAVIGCGIVSMVIGSIWYGPLFGKLWAKGMGWDPKDKAQMDKMKKMAAPAYFQQFIGALLMAFVFAHVLWAFGVASPETKNVGGALQGALWMWLGFILPVKYGDKLWGGKKFSFVAIDLGYYLVLTAVFGIILTLWK